MKEEGTVTKSFVYATFIITIVAWAAAVAIIALLAAYGYMGFDGSNALGISACTQPYFQAKFINSVSDIVKAVFASSIVAGVTSTIVFLILLMWIIKVCKGQNPMGQISRCSLLALYVFSSIFAVSSSVVAGYHVSYFFEIGNCTNTADAMQLLILMAVAGLMVILAVVVWILLLCIYVKGVDPEEKYREVQENQTYPTEPNERVQQKQNTPKARKEEEVVRNKYQPRKQAEETKGYLFESPETKKEILHKKEPQQPIYNKPNTYQKYESPYKSPFTEVKRRENDNNPMPSNQYTKSPNEDGLIYSKARKDPYTRQDEDDLHKEQKRYMSRYGGGSILPSSGVQEKESRDRKLGSDYFRSGQAPRRHIESSPPRKPDERSGVLLNHIRGKYAA